MVVIDALALERCLSYEAAVQAIETVFQIDQTEEHRHLHDLTQLSNTPGTCMAALPAWAPGVGISTKVFTVFPDNPGLGKPTVQAMVVLFDDRDGSPQALVDGTLLTLIRTAAMSATASKHLARPESHRLLLCGAGALAPHAALAHASVLPIQHIDVWARRPEAAKKTADFIQKRRPDVIVQATTDLAEAASLADLVSGQTSAETPYMRGEWISPGTHCDFAGSHSPSSREFDDALIQKASLYVDGIDTATTHPGDIVVPLRTGVISKQDILGDLKTICRSGKPLRNDQQEITLFKSSGSGLADLATARAAFDAHKEKNPPAI